MTSAPLAPPRHNWSGSVRFDPERVAAPRSEAEVVSLINAARAEGKTVRVVGGGHSFTPIAAGSDVLITLDGFHGLVRADVDAGLATLYSGTRLFRVRDLLAPLGLGLSVMGDIDSQSIAGAIQTGTHGTGSDFTGFAGMVRGLRIALADGSVVEASEEHNSDLFHAARLGLGMMGVILEVTLQCVPRYSLALSEAIEPLDTVTRSFMKRADNLDHHEFFWFPRTGRATTRTFTRVSSETPRERRGAAGEWVERELLGNITWEQLCRLSYVARPLTRPIADFASRVFKGASMVDDAPAVYANSRRVRFHEGEFAIPAERFEEAFAALRSRLDDENVRVVFPLEIRRAAADDVWMSTAYQRDSVYIAAHTYHLCDPVPYLLMVQRTLEPFGARPHWGKMHWMRGEQLRQLYPKWDEFLAVRHQADPDGMFLTSYLRSVFAL